MWLQGCIPFPFGLTQLATFWLSPAVLGVVLSTLQHLLFNLPRVGETAILPGQGNLRSVYCCTTHQPPPYSQIYSDFEAKTQHQKNCIDTTFIFWWSISSSFFFLTKVMCISKASTSSTGLLNSLSRFPSWCFLRNAEVNVGTLTVMTYVPDLALTLSVVYIASMSSSAKWG